MTFDFAALKFRPPASFPVVVASVHEAESRLEAEAIVELWQKRSAIHESENVELRAYYRAQGAPEWMMRRACELCAAADLALQYGDCICDIIRPLVTTEPSSV